MQTKWDKIKAMAAEGKSLDDIKTSFGESTAPPARNPNGGPPAMSMTEVMYGEITKKS
jgi:hypothetical protein